MLKLFFTTIASSIASDAHPPVKTLNYTDGGHYLIIISVILGVLLLQELSLSLLLLQGLLDERGHLALLARLLSANDKPAFGDSQAAFHRVETENPGCPCGRQANEPLHRDSTSF